MPSIREYSSIDREEYFQLTQFDKAMSRPLSHQELEQIAQTRGKFVIKRMEITLELAQKLIIFIHSNEINTRGPTPDIDTVQNPTISRTIFTVHFCLHIIAGKRGGWYILEDRGREPIIKDEFIEFGEKRKSGGRKNRYRRNLSYSEKNQVDYLKQKTPTMNQICYWIIIKYYTIIKNIDITFSQDDAIVPW